MNFKRLLAINIALALVVASFFFFFSQKGLLKRPELSGLDLMFRLRPSFSYNQHIIIVEVTDMDILSVGRWPWKRTWHGALAKTLHDLGAKSVYFDILFSEAASEEEDGLLEEAFKVTGNVYLPFAFERAGGEMKIIEPLERFLPVLKGAGAMNIYPDTDGIQRRIPLAFSINGKPAYHIALKLAMDYAKVGVEKALPDRLFLSGPGGKMSIPLAESGNAMLINWAGKWQNTFRHYDYLDVLAAQKDILDNKKPAIDTDYFKDAVCLVGVSAVGLHDIKPTPLEPESPGIGIIAMAINTVLDRRFINDPPQWANIAPIFILALLPAFLVFGEKPLRETIFAFAAGCTYFIASFLLFQNGIHLKCPTHLLTFFSSYFTIGIYNFIRVAIERRNFLKMSVTDGLTGLYNIRYFKMVLDTEFMLTRAGRYEKFCIIMSDIDHFKQFNDKYGHQVGDLVLKEAAAILMNSVRSLDIVARYGGEEMIVLLRGANLQEGLAIAEKIRKNVEAADIKDEKNSYHVTISLGISGFMKGDNVDTLIKRADEQLYKAKEAGRNQVCCQAS